MFSNSFNDETVYCVKIQFVVFLGQQFDKIGNIRQWWTMQTTADFINRTECFVEQYDNYHIEEIDGNVSCPAISFVFLYLAATAINHGTGQLMLYDIAFYIVEIAAILDQLFCMCSKLHCKICDNSFMCIKYNIKYSKLAYACPLKGRSG